MLKNYLTIALRNLRKQKGYTFINIFGLALGMACCILILLFVQYELSFDRFHTKADQIYRLVEIQTFSGRSPEHVGLTMGMMGQAMVDEYPEITAAPPAVGSTVRWTHVFPTSLVGWIYFHASNHSVEQADQWVTGLREGIGRSEDSPILALRLRMQRHYGGVAILRGRSILMGGIKSWNAFAEERPLKRIQVGPNERPPAMVGDRSPPRDYEKRGEGV